MKKKNKKHQCYEAVVQDSIEAHDATYLDNSIFNLETNDCFNDTQTKHKKKNHQVSTNTEDLAKTNFEQNTNVIEDTLIHRKKKHKKIVSDNEVNIYENILNIADNLKPVEKKHKNVSDNVQDTNEVNVEEKLPLVETTSKRKKVKRKDLLNSIDNVCEVNVEQQTVSIEGIPENKKKKQKKVVNEIQYTNGTNTEQDAPVTEDTSIRKKNKYKNVKTSAEELNNISVDTNRLDCFGITSSTPKQKSMKLPCHNGLVEVNGTEFSSCLESAIKSRKKKHKDHKVMKNQCAYNEVYQGSDMSIKSLNSTNSSTLEDWNMDKSTKKRKKRKREKQETVSENDMENLCDENNMKWEANLIKESPKYTDNSTLERKTNYFENLNTQNTTKDKKKKHSKTNDLNFELGASLESQTVFDLDGCQSPIIKRKKHKREKNVPKIVKHLINETITNDFTEAPLKHKNKKHKKQHHNLEHNQYDLHNINLEFGVSSVKDTVQSNHLTISDDIEGSQKQEELFENSKEKLQHLNESSQIELHVSNHQVYENLQNVQDSDEKDRERLKHNNTNKACLSPNKISFSNLPNYKSIKSPISSNISETTELEFSNVTHIEHEDNDVRVEESDTNSIIQDVREKCKKKQTKLHKDLRKSQEFNEKRVNDVNEEVEISVKSSGASSISALESDSADNSKDDKTDIDKRDRDSLLTSQSKNKHLEQKDSESENARIEQAIIDDFNTSGK